MVMKSYWHSSPFTCRPSVMYDLCGPSGDSHGENGEFQYPAWALRWGAADLKCSTKQTQKLRQDMTLILYPRTGLTHPSSLFPSFHLSPLCPPRQVNWSRSTRTLCERRCVQAGRICWGVAFRCSFSTVTGSPGRTNATTMRVGHTPGINCWSTSDLAKLFC